jgi:hypothetical protein
MATSGGIATDNDEIRSDEWIAVEEVLLRAGSGGRRPNDSSAFYVEGSEHAIARADEDDIARNRGRVRQSAARLKLPDRFGLKESDRDGGTGEPIPFQHGNDP